MTATGDAARQYHRLTSYEPGREWTTPVDDPMVRQDFSPNDLDLLPPPVKSYPTGLPVIPLPRDLPTVDTPATAVLADRGHGGAGHGGAGHGGASGGVDLAGLARLLYLSAGVVRTGQRPGRPRILFRAAGSAGARFPLELYVAARGVAGLPDGVHWYDPVGHALVRIGPEPRGTTTTVVVTGVPWRTGWRYAERGLRHIYWDGGTMLAQLLALADSAGLAPRLRTTFPDGEVTQLVGADGVHEFPIALVSLGDGEPATGPTAIAVAGSIDARPLEFPLVTLTQRAGDGDRMGEPWPVGAPLPAAGIDPTSPDPSSPDLSWADPRWADPSSPDPSWSDSSWPDPSSPDPSSADPSSLEQIPLDRVILRRGSTRRMVKGAAVPRATLEFALAAALRGVADHRPDPQFVAVHAVTGVQPGLYRWPDLDHPVRAGDLRDEIQRICLDQCLGGEAAYVVISTADLATVDDRDYRDAQLAAGIVEGRLHLAAFALGAGATGMTFLDSELPALLGAPLDGMIFTCVGVPEYANRAGGRPGEPVRIRPVNPRSADS